MARLSVDAESVAVSLSDGVVKLFGEGAQKIESVTPGDASHFRITLPNGQVFEVQVTEVVT